MVVDDYGHHPTEIRAVLAAARAGLDRRVILVFQPHRYTRTIRLLDEFGSALAEADEIVLTEVYGAGETPIPGATAAAMAASVRQAGQSHVRVVESLEDVAEVVLGLVRARDLVITLGAGSIGDVAGTIVGRLESARPAGAGRKERRG